MCMGFSGNLFAVLISYFEVANISMGIAFGITVDVNSTGCMTAKFSYSVY